MVSLDKKLIEEGTKQISSEIKVLERWLAEIEASGKEDADSLAAKKSYNDMLRSRREMLDSLVLQTRAF